MKSNLKAIGDNEASFKKLLSFRDDLVPFIGAGFSCPICPGWGAFLDNYLASIKTEFLTPDELLDYQAIKTSDDPDRFEKMADFLVNKSQRRKFAEQLQDKFGQSCPDEHQHKFHLLHRAFPGLKITTNYDQLIEDNHPIGKHVEIARGNRPDDLERLFTKRRDNCLLKIHGGLRDSSSIVLSSQQYQEIYGAEQDFAVDAALPVFLKRLFSNSSVLYIGCSLENDRVLAVLQSLDQVRPHFALIKRPQQQQQVVAINRRLSRFQITPIWFQDYDDIAELLQCLAPVVAIVPALETVSTFVGREKELDQIEQALTSDQGNVQMISGRLFNIEGAGGVGKTTLALTAAKRLGHLAKHGVLGPFRTDEMTAQTYAVALARTLDIRIDPPADDVSAQALISQLLQDRHCLIILDNAVDWQSLRYMLPKQSPATIIVTTRDRDMGMRLRSHFEQTLTIDEIKLHHFTPEEALNLFHDLLMDAYQEQDRTRYDSIAKQLGYLPIALRQVIALIKYSPHYSAEQLLDKLASDGRLAVLRKGQAADDSDERSIDAVFDLASPALLDELLEALQYLAICAPGPIPLNFLEHLSSNPDIAEILEQLHTYNWCERRDEAEQRYYELHQLVRELIFERFGKRFIEPFIATIDAIFMDEAIHFSVKDGLIAQLNQALVWAEESKDQRIINWLYPLYDFCTFRGHLTLYAQLTEIIERSFGEDKDTLNAALGNRAGILKAWGKLNEAMALHQKEQSLCEALGDQAGLSISYGNQAMILKNWGKLDEAMALLQKQQSLCEALGDQAGLSISYGNQALILKDWGKLDEAMALLQKQQSLCEALGNQAGLAISLWNQGSIYTEQGQKQQQIKLWKRSIEINKAIGIPTEDDENALKKLLEK